MLDKYTELTDIFVQNKLGTNREAQRYDRVGTTTNLILIDILEELKGIKEMLVTKQVVAEVVKEKIEEEVKVKPATNSNKSSGKSK
ncbi:MAG: hypothetical protein ACRCZH_04015 [Cetobacterium sp.]